MSEAMFRTGSTIHATTDARSRKVFWWVPMPPERLAVLRILVGCYGVIATAAQYRRLADWSAFLPLQFRPIGIVKLVLQAPLPLWVMPILWGLTLAFGIPFVLGWRFRWTAPIYSCLLLWLYTYRSCWGQIFHTDNLLILHTFILTFSRSADRLSVHNASALAEPPSYGWPVRLMGAVAVLAYFVAGVAKLRYAGLSWVTSDTLLHHVAFDNLRKIELGDIYSPLAPWLLKFPPLFTFFAVFTMVIELAAPLALFHSRFAKIWSFGMWAFHLGILMLMAIFFAYPLLGFAFFPFFEPERLFLRLLPSLHARDKRVDDLGLHRLAHDGG